MNFPDELLDVQNINLLLVHIHSIIYIQQVEPIENIHYVTNDTLFRG